MAVVSPANGQVVRRQAAGLVWRHASAGVCCMADLTLILSAREQEVLRLVAKGLTSKAIAKQLVLSPKTVDHHLSSILNKLGVENRAHAVATAVRDGLF